MVAVALMESGARKPKSKVVYHPYGRFQSSPEFAWKYHLHATANFAIFCPDRNNGSACQHSAQSNRSSSSTGARWAPSGAL